MPKKDENTLYRLTCPHCGSDEILVKQEHLDAQGCFIGNPKVGCMKCKNLFHVSDLEPSEPGDTVPRTLHAVKGGESA